MLRKSYYFITLILLLLFLGACQEDSKNPNNDYKYVGSVNSNIYHYTSCTWAQRIKESNLISFESVSDAKSSGYRACKVCKPPRD